MIQLKHFSFACFCVVMMLDLLDNVLNFLQSATSLA